MTIWSDKIQCLFVSLALQYMYNNKRINFFLNLKTKFEIGNDAFLIFNFEKRVRLSAVLDRIEFDSALSWTELSLTQRCPGKHSV